MNGKELNFEILMKSGAFLLSLALLIGRDIGVASDPVLLKNEACKIRDEATSIEYNLWPLRSDDANYRIESPQGSFVMNICGSLTDGTSIEGCDPDAAVCRLNDHISLGYATDSSLELVGGNLRYAFTGGSKCSGGGDRARTAVVWLQCDPNAITGHPTFDSMSEDECDFTFRWSHADLCVGQDMR